MKYHKSTRKENTQWGYIYLVVGFVFLMIGMKEENQWLYLASFLMFIIAGYRLLILEKVRRKQPQRKKLFLPPKIKSKADRKYSMILNKFKRNHKRKPTKDDLFRIVITASHHTYPVKGRNSRRWMRGNSGHWKRQKVRKYLLEKHNIVERFIMK